MIEGEVMDELEIARDAERERRSEGSADRREEFAGGGEPPLNPAVFSAGSTPGDIVEIGGCEHIVARILGWRVVAAEWVDNFHGVKASDVGQRRLLAFCQWGVDEEGGA
jgi:hypothetical protein